MLRGRALRPTTYHAVHMISEVKHHWVCLVLERVTAWDHQLLVLACLSTSPPGLGCSLLQYTAGVVYPWGSASLHLPLLVCVRWGTPYVASFRSSATAL